MAKAQWRQTGAGPHEDRRTHRNRDRQAQNRHAIEEEFRAEDPIRLSPAEARQLEEVRNDIPD